VQVPLITIVQSRSHRDDPRGRSPQVKFDLRAAFGPRTGIIVPVELEPLNLIGCHMDKVEALCRRKMVLGGNLRRRAGYAPVPDDHIRSEAFWKPWPARKRLLLGLSSRACRFDQFDALSIDVRSGPPIGIQ
jgi:hypothetical protein